MECKGLEIRPIRGGYMLTNQRRVYVDQSERRSSKLDQSEPSSQNAMRDTPDYKRHRAFISPIPFSDTVQK